MKFNVKSLAALLAVGLFSNMALANPPHDHRYDDHRPPPPQNHVQPPPPPPPPQRVQPPPPPPPPQYNVRPAPPPPPPPQYNTRPAPPPPQYYVRPAPPPPQYHRHHRSWEVGRSFPREVTYYKVSSPKYYRLPPPRRGHRYIRVDNDILLINAATNVIIQVMYGAAR